MEQSDGPSRVRVLYVDDSRFDRELVRDALERDDGGFVVTTAGSRREFEAALAGLERNFDLVLTDFNILGFTGLNVLRAVHARNSRFPVMVVTGTGSEEVAVEAMKAGASDYVIKTPMHIRRLPTTITNVLAHHKALQVSERAAAEARDARARFELAMNSGHMGVFDWDLMTGQIVWSGQYASLFGLEPDQFDSRYDSFTRCILPEDVAGLERAIQAAREQRTVFENEFRVVWPDQSIHWIVGRGRFIYDSLGIAMRMSGIVLDVTPRHDAEDAARKLQSQLAHLLRLNLLGQIASGLAHEINQPLSAISNFVGAALRLGEDGKLTTERGRDIMRDIASQAHRAAEIVRRLRNFIRQTPADFISIDINAVVAEAIGLMTRELSDGRVRAHFTPGARLPRLQADTIQIQQVLVNLIQNAIDAMKDTPLERRRIEIATIPSFGQVIIRVTDNGRGIDPDNLPRIFDSFYTTKSQGLGMGLNISRSIVESHGGNLTASNDANGGGAVFEFVLPVDPEPSPEGKSTP